MNRRCHTLLNLGVQPQIINSTIQLQEKLPLILTFGQAKIIPAVHLRANHTKVLLATWQRVHSWKGWPICTMHSISRLSHLIARRFVQCLMLRKFKNRASIHSINEISTKAHLQSYFTSYLGTIAKQH
jgi:hypothetical protein